MLNTAAKCRIIQHINNCSVNVRDWHLGMMSPNRLSTENLISVDMFQREFESLSRLVFLADSLASDYDNILEDLFSEVPMLRGRSARNIGRAEQRRHENPGIV